MFIKITSTILYIFTVCFLLFLSFKQSVSYWVVSENTLFFIMMIVVSVLILMLIIAVIHLRSTILEWQHAKSILQDRKQMVFDTDEDDDEL